MKKLSLAFVAAFVLAGCAHHGHTSATAEAEKDCCANKKGGAMAEGKTCEHDMTTAEGKAACDHEKEETAAAAVASPTPAPH
jgi:hypothetical protein